MNKSRELEKKETYMLYVWNDGQGNLTMSQLTENTIPYWKRFYDYHLLVSGRAANVWCFFSDYDIRDSELKKMATKFMKGNYNIIEVSSYDGKVTKKRGVNRLNPR